MSDFYNKLVDAFTRETAKLGGAVQEKIRVLANDVNKSINTKIDGVLSKEHDADDADEADDADNADDAEKELDILPRAIIFAKAGESTNNLMRGVALFLVVDSATGRKDYCIAYNKSTGICVVGKFEDIHRYGEDNGIPIITAVDRIGKTNGIITMTGWHVTRDVSTLPQIQLRDSIALADRASGRL